MGAASTLAASYPQLYTNVRCDIDIGPGWLPILLDLSAAIVARGADIRVEQVKEKFGGLRFYYSGDDIDDLVELAEQRAWVTCEVCGEAGHRRSGGWIMVLCDEHQTARRREVP